MSAVDEIKEALETSMHVHGSKAMQHAEELDRLRAEKMQAVTDLTTFQARLKETQIAYRKTCLRLETERDDLLIETRDLRVENDRLRQELATARRDALHLLESTLYPPPDAAMIVAWKKHEDAYYDGATAYRNALIRALAQKDRT